MFGRFLPAPVDGFYSSQLYRFDGGLIVSGGVLSLPRLPVWVLPGCAGPCFGVLLRRISVLTIKKNSLME